MEYKLTDNDVVLQWKLSMDTKAYKNSNGAVSLMLMNGTGLYLLARDGSKVIIQVVFTGPSGFRIVLNLARPSSMTDEVHCLLVLPWTSEWRMKVDG
nr:hypothetical protein CFP56_38502 [Quercus suber]